MRMIVVNGNPVDLLQQPVVNFLHISTGQWPRLRVRHNGHRQRH